MAQATGSITMRITKMEYSPDGSAWTDFSGYFNKIEISGGERELGEFYTADGEMPVIGLGKMSPYECKITALYNESPSGFFETLRARFENVGDVYFRYSPGGGDSGDFMFTSDKGYVQQFQFPQGEVNGGQPIPVMIQFITPRFVKSVVA